jgi:integrase
VSLARIDNLMIREWVADLGRRADDGGAGLAPGSIAKVFQVLDAALQAAVDAKMIPSNPADRVPLPADERDEKRFLLPEEVLHLGDAMPDRYRVLVLLAASTGLRIGELAGLRKNRLDLLRGRLEVMEIVTEVQGHVRLGPPKTKAGRRMVPIPRSVVDELVAHLAAFGGEGPDGLAFPGRDGGVLRPAAWLRRVWHPAVVRAGVAPLTPHELRHTAVAWWISAGVDPKRIAAWAGHRSVKTILDTYGHLLPSDDDALTARVDALLTNAYRRSEGKVLAMRR